jgi:hypothetical protein
MEYTLVEIINRVLYKLDDLVRPYVHKILVVIEPLLIGENYHARVESWKYARSPCLVHTLLGFDSVLRTLISCSGSHIRYPYLALRTHYLLPISRTHDSSEPCTNYSYLVYALLGCDTSLPTYYPSIWLMGLQTLLGPHTRYGSRPSHIFITLVFYAIIW